MSPDPLIFCVFAGRVRKHKTVCRAFDTCGVSDVFCLAVETLALGARTWTFSLRLTAKAIMAVRRLGLGKPLQSWLGSKFPLLLCEEPTQLVLATSLTANRQPKTITATHSWSQLPDSAKLLQSSDSSSRESSSRVC